MLNYESQSSPSFLFPSTLLLMHLTFQLQNFVRVCVCVIAFYLIYDTKKLDTFYDTRYELLHNVSNAIIGYTFSLPLILTATLK